MAEGRIGTMPSIVEYETANPGSCAKLEATLTIQVRDTVCWVSQTVKAKPEESVPRGYQRGHDDDSPAAQGASRVSVQCVGVFVLLGGRLL